MSYPHPGNICVMWHNSGRVHTEEDAIQMGILGKRYHYVIAQDGYPPVWDGEPTDTFRNPVSTGDHIMPVRMGEKVRKVLRIEHYRQGSVLYVQEVSGN